MTKLGWVEASLGLAASVIGFVGLIYLFAVFFVFGYARESIAEVSTADGVVREWERDRRLDVDPRSLGIALAVGTLVAVPIGGIGAGALWHARDGLGEGLHLLTVSSMLLFAGSVVTGFSVGLPLIPAGLIGMVATVVGLIGA